MALDWYAPRYSHQIQSLGTANLCLCEEFWCRQSKEMLRQIMKQIFWTVWMDWFWIMFTMKRKLKIYHIPSGHLPTLSYWDTSKKRIFYSPSLGWQTWSGEATTFPSISTENITALFTYERWWECELVSSSSGQMIPDSKFLLPISGQLSQLINPLLSIRPSIAQTIDTQNNASVHEIFKIPCTHRHIPPPPHIPKWKPWAERIKRWDKKGSGAEAGRRQDASISNLRGLVQQFRNKDNLQN